MGSKPQQKLAYAPVQNGERVLDCTDELKASDPAVMKVGSEDQEE